jgi:hypothetical protein
MKSISIHSLDEQLEASIRKKSEEWGLSLNKTIKNLLADKLGLSSTDKKSDFSRFCGVWSDQEKKDFDERVLELQDVDSRDWK